MVTPLKVDVAIIGGGLVAGTLGFALAQQGFSAGNITVITHFVTLPYIFMGSPRYIKTSRLPTWFAWLMTPFFSIISIMPAALL